MTLLEGKRRMCYALRRKDQDKRRASAMKMQIIVNIKKEDGSELTESTTVEANIPEIESFTCPRVFD